MKKIEIFEKHIEKSLENIVQHNISPNIKMSSKRDLINKILEHKY